VSESNADLARDMRAIILDQLKQGKSREQIVEYFVARYGDYVLMSPPVRGPGLLRWVVPAGGFGLLGITAFVYLRHRRREMSPPAPTLTVADRKRIEKARKDESDL
jgi:cytochrome c-type biogenesis protein CcmH